MEYNPLDTNKRLVQLELYLDKIKKLGESSLDVVTRLIELELK
jgi:hypothetical protein